MKPWRRPRIRKPIVVPTIALLLLLALSGSFAHQTLSLSIPEEEIGAAPPPMPGSARFLSEALSLLRPRCDGAANERLDRIEQLVRDANLVRWGGLPGVDPRAAENLRAEAESELVALLEGLPDPMLLDLASPDGELERVTVDPQHSTLLIRIVDGEGQSDVQLVDWDLTTESFDRDTQLVLSRRGTTHLLIRVAGLPDEPATVRFAVRRQNEPTPVLGKAVQLLTPPTGRWIISVRDEDDQPTHSIVAIRSTAGGAYREPPSSIDLRGQLNDIVSEIWVNELGKGYVFQLPGRKRGRHWVTPPETDMTLPVGEWEICLQRGPEHTPIIERVRIEAGRTTRTTHTFQRWIDMPSQGWWSGDDHVHARLMSGADARRLLDYAEAVDLHVANILEMGDPLRTYYSQRGFGRDYRAGRGNRWLTPGQEDPRSDLGHAIGLNLKEQVRDVDRYLQNDLLAKEIHAGGGLYGHTHVSDGACFAHRQMALFTPQGIVDFTSIMQSALGVDLYYDFLNLGFKLTASAGADTPYAGTMGAVRVYAHTGENRLETPDEWFSALAAGRTFVTNGPMLELSVDGQGPGATVESQGKPTVRVLARARGDAGWSAPRTLHIVRLGEKVSTAQSDDPSKAMLSAEAAVEVGAGCWIAATATGHDGSQAHTTPVYVPGEGGWHGDRERAPEIAKKQLRVLEEIEKSVLQAAEQHIANGTRHPLDLQTLTNASQAEAVRSRIGVARRYYQELVARP